MDWFLRWKFDNPLAKWYVEHLGISIPITIALFILSIFHIYKEDKKKRDQFFKESEQDDK